MGSVTRMKVLDETLKSLLHVFEAADRTRSQVQSHPSAVLADALRVLHAVQGKSRFGPALAHNKVAKDAVEFWQGLTRASA